MADADERLVQLHQEGILFDEEYAAARACLDPALPRRPKSPARRGGWLLVAALVGTGAVFCSPSSVTTPITSSSDVPIPNS